MPAEPPASPAEGRRAVGVSAPGRLHLGFLDPAGSLGRRFGSLGLVIDGFETRVVLRAAGADRNAVDAPVLPPTRDTLDAQARAAACLRLLGERSGRDAPLSLTLERLLPAHAGFGSGTQLALAVGRAFAHWHGLALDTPTLAGWLGRGLRSGVGIAGFDAGGLLLDGGPGGDGRPAPLLSRIALPPAWTVVVMQDARHRGLSGADERAALARLPPLGRHEAADVCHQVLMRVLAGAADGDFAAFARGLSRVQQVLGVHFAPAQNGSAYTSPAVARMAGWLADAAGEGGAAVGQSSWGPTGFAILPSAGRAAALIDAARAAGAVDSGLVVDVVAARNHGARIVDSAAAGARPAPPAASQFHPSEPPARPLENAR